MKEIDDVLDNIKRPLVDDFFEEKFFKGSYAEALISAKNS